MPRRLQLAFLVPALAGGCLQQHSVPLGDSRVTPSEAPVPHGSRLWLDVESATPAVQCSAQEGRLPVCFEDADAAIASALHRVLHPSFLGVVQRGRDDDLAPKDYLLHVRLRLRPVGAGGSEIGHAVLVQGTWQLVRDGFSVAGESFEVRSRAGFTYGAPLAVGAEEALDAVALRIGERVTSLPVTDPEPARRLPAVTAVGAFGPPPVAAAHAAR